jgi:hypothetical protein
MTKRNPFQAQPADPYATPAGARGRGPGMNRGGHGGHGGGGMGNPLMPRERRQQRRQDQRAALGGPPATSDDLTMQFYNDNPQEGFGASMSGMFGPGVMGGGDAFSGWMNRQFEPTYQNFMTQKLGNENLRFDHYIAGLGGPEYWRNAYNMAGMEAKGLTYSPYQGQSRWLAFG